MKPIFAFQKGITYSTTQWLLVEMTTVAHASEQGCISAPRRILLRQSSTFASGKSIDKQITILLIGHETSAR